MQCVECAADCEGKFSAHFFSLCFFLFLYILLKLFLYTTTVLKVVFNQCTSEVYICRPIVFREKRIMKYYIVKKKKDLKQKHNDN